MTRTIKLLSMILAGLVLINASALFVLALEAEESMPPEVRTVQEEVAPSEAFVFLAERDATEETESQEQETWETESEETEPVETNPAETEEEVPEQTDDIPETEPEETVPETEPIKEKKVYNTVPLYYQNDYPDTMFGYGTVASSGCSITCLAMVGTYLTDHEYLPDELAGYFGAHGQNNMARMEYGIRKMQLPCTQAENWHVVMNALEKGKVVIMLVDERSIFTESQHFIVLTGLTEDGKVMVLDCNRDSYDRWDLKDKFVTGFLESDLWRGFNGAWCFDKKAMPKDPFIYYEEEVQVEPRYVGVTLTMDERELLARMVWVEARGEPLEGQQAVAEVVLNRLVAGNFQNSIESIIMAEGQFNSAPFLDDAEPNQTQYEAVEHALKGPYVTPINTVFFGLEPTPLGSLWRKIGGHCFSTQWRAD